MFGDAEHPHRITALTTGVQYGVGSPVYSKGQDACFTLLQPVQQPTAEKSQWRVCDVTAFGAVGDGASDDTGAIRRALAACDEVVLPFGKA